MKQFDELKLLGFDGASILAGITKHVMAEGVTAKMRDMRKEFFSKAEFKNEAMKLLTKLDLEIMKKELIKLKTT